jgi:hypothetical protein
MKRALLLSGCLVLAGAWSAAATPINGSATGLTGPHSTITFEEHVLPMNSVVSNQYADLGVTFSPFVYYSPQGGFGTNGNDVGNFTFPTEPAFVNPVTLSFSGPRSGVAFGMAADVTPYTFTAFSGIVPVETFSTTVAGSLLYYGFEGIAFDSLVIAENGAGGGPYWLLDNLQQRSGAAAAVPEPATLLLLGSGLIMAGRRRWQKRQPRS